MRSREPGNRFNLNNQDEEGERPSRSVVLVRGLIGGLLATFAVLLLFLIVRGRTLPETSQRLTPASPTATAKATAMTQGLEVPTLVVAQESPQNLAVTPLPEGTDAAPLIEIVPVITERVATAAAISLPVNLAGFVAKPLPTAQTGQPNPFFAPNFDANDGKPIYVCAASSFPSYWVLMQMQTAGLDVQHGFHLGIVPLGIGEPAYELLPKQAEAFVINGVWDCLLNTLDTVARTGYGVMTTVIDESAGGDGIYARGVPSIYELKGKRLGFVKDSPAEMFARYVLQVAQITTATVTLVPYKNSAAVSLAFDGGQIDAIAGRGQALLARVAAGGTPLVTSDQLRVMLDVVVTSAASIQNKPQLVQQFHDAWFSTLKLQLENVDGSATAIVTWGHNDWLTLRKDNAAADLRAQLPMVAQADLRANAQLMTNSASIYNLINVTRRIWASAGGVDTINAKSLVEPQFVLAAAAKPELQTTAQPLNKTFSLK